ncbi:MAG: caspase family protein, partial [Actinobacteria bacterium]|nr:caspase family protein [Actinomycetota bacterium]
GSNDAKAGFLDDVDGMERATKGLGYTTTKIKPPAKNGKTEFEAAVKASIADGCKNVLLFIAGHGSKESVDMGTGTYTPADLKKLMDANPTITFKVVVQACKSGSWIDALKDRVEIIETSTDATKPSYSADPDTASDPNPGDKGSEFTSGLIEDLELIKDSPAAQIQIQGCIMGVPPLIAGKSPLVCQLEWAFASALEKDEDAAAGNEAPQKHQR